MTRKPIRLAINGCGRIGGAVLEIALATDAVEVVALNDVKPMEQVFNLLRFDSVRGHTSYSIEMTDENFLLNGQAVPYFRFEDPADLLWKSLEVDVVVEATGVHKTRAACQRHLDAGAKRVVLTVPPKDEVDAMVVLGVNDEVIKPTQRLFSNASCTTNCLAPLVVVLQEAFGLEWGYMTTIHAYTSDQRLHDAPHSDDRRAFAASENIIWTTTGAARAVGKVFDDVEGLLDGDSFRVPVINGSVVKLIAGLDKTVTQEEVNTAVQEAANRHMKGILQYSKDPLVSRMVLRNSHSSIFDSLATKVLPTGQVVLQTWYDNEWGYSTRVVDLVRRVGRMPLAE